MKEVETAVEKIKKLPDGYVDINYLQGNEAFIEQLSSSLVEFDSDIVGTRIKELHKTIADIKYRAKPHIIPKEYIFFLEFYGGLCIDSESCYFSTFGLGPKVEEWYSAIDSPSASPETLKNGFLAVGKINFRKGPYKYQHLTFFLDLTGKIQKDCILAIGPSGHEGPNSDTITKNIQEHSGTWYKVADSFTHWLKYAAETNGAYGFA